mmetsp:Transcript_48247/g.87004  ORF Transcript_48247/g.87004 Transcript_48247/m.87004 type:complete len:82 (-) Transcript_48247:2610-2855(-)
MASRSCGSTSLCSRADAASRDTDKALEGRRMLAALEGRLLVPAELDGFLKRLLDEGIAFEAALDGRFENRGSRGMGIFSSS